MGGSDLRYGVKPKRPFLKWAGAKTKVIPAIRAVTPADARRFVEPFVGSGAVALNLNPPQCVLADTNRDLIAVYQALQRDGEAFVALCATLFLPENNTPGAYYARRDEFNASEDVTRKAALFVYLNRHGYNGLCRYNLEGKFNTPFGRYTAPRLPADLMRQYQAFLQRCEIRHADFRTVIQQTGPGDFVYCDPPYTPASETANFTSYSQHGFTARDQADLAACCRAAAQRGAWVAVSNHDTPETRELYRDASERHELMVARNISCHSATRMPVKELLVVYRPAREPALVRQ
jgi:DNA adenine methylase